jgi:prepilin-type processing-associated H-X9-DG protein
MSDQRREDEQLLIDYVLNQCSDADRQRVEQRLDEDEQLAALHENIKRSFLAMELAPRENPPEDLLERTMSRIESAKRTRQLIEQQEMTRGRAYWPTFSLRELSAMAAVVLLLVAVFVPSLQKARRRTVRSECAAQAGQIGHAVQRYATSNNDQLPHVDAQTTRWLPRGDEEYVNPSRSLFTLIRQDMASPVWFQCPAVGGPSFVVEMGQTDFPAGRYVSYSYQHSLGEGLSRQEASVASNASQLAILADDTPLFRDGEFVPARLENPVSDNHGREGQNVLYLDGHVHWSPQPYVGVGNNNIYLVDGVHEYSGTERPRDKTDSFLLPSFSGR